MEAANGEGLLIDQAKQYHEELVELAIEQDEDLLMAYLEGEMPSGEDLKRCLRKGTLAGAFVPVLTGTAFKNKGVQNLLDAIIDYMPSPLDVEAIKGTKSPARVPLRRQRLRSSPDGISPSR